MYIAIRTDKENAEVHLLDNNTVVDRKVWEAGRTLARDLPGVIDEMLNNDYRAVRGVVVFAGPGSFTGLRIGITVANTLSYSLEVPIVGASGDDWLLSGAERLEGGENDQLVTPIYNFAPKITPPKK